MRIVPNDMVRWPVRVVAIRGPSMVPALRHGDLVLCWYGWGGRVSQGGERGVSGGPRVRPGNVVVARFRTREDLLVVKRAVRPVDGGWWLAGDNAYGSDDSEAYGPADVVARVMWRYWPFARFGRVRRITPKRP